MYKIDSHRFQTLVDTLEDESSGDDDNYRQPSNDLESLEALQVSPTKLYRSKQTMPNVAVAGDFNLPDINCGSQQTTNTRTASKQNKLLEIISEFGLQNLVNDPTQFKTINMFVPHLHKTRQTILKDKRGARTTITIIFH